MYRDCTIYVVAKTKGAISFSVTAQYQLFGYRTVDLRLCFVHMQKAGILMIWLIVNRPAKFTRMNGNGSCLSNTRLQNLTTV